MPDRFEQDAALVASLVGRTIVAATWIDAGQDDEWSGHEEALLTLDDGRKIEFSAYGYDAWGATVRDATNDTPEPDDAE